MEVYRISNCRYINDLSGTGAAMYPGRWNTYNTYIVYTAGSRALAMLEAVAHIGNAPIPELCMATIEIQDNIMEMEMDRLPANWADFPSPENLKLIGTAFVNSDKYTALKVPSAIVPQEYNYLLNPNSRNFHKLVKIKEIHKISIDKRLLK